MSRTLQVCIALIGAPVAWIVQMSLSEPLVSNACYPHQAPLEVPRWESLSPWLTAISLACLAAGILSGVIAWRSWRQQWPEQAFRFLARMGVISSFIFIVALLLTASASFLVLPCHPWF